MADITTDELLAKVASATGVEPLAHTLGVKLAGADAILDGIWQQQFYNEMAKAGHVATNEQEAAEMLKVAFEVEALLGAVDAEEPQSSKSAAWNVSAAPYAEEADYAKHAIATADLLGDSGVVAHIASLLDAQQILN